MFLLVFYWNSDTDIGLLQTINNDLMMLRNDVVS